MPLVHRGHDVSRHCCGSFTLRKDDSTCGANVCAQRGKPARAGNGSSEAHRLAARLAEAARFGGFLSHRPPCRFCNRAARCSKEHTKSLARDEARRIATKIVELTGLMRKTWELSFKVGRRCRSQADAQRQIRRSGNQGANPPGRKSPLTFGQANYAIGRGEHGDDDFGAADGYRNLGRNGDWFRTRPHLANPV
jgi:hypothetical protein